MLPFLTHCEPHLAVTVPELVFRIFEQLPASDLVSAAQVCKDWEWTATDTLRRCHAVKLSALLEKIGPVKSYIFEESPSQEGCLAFSLQGVPADRWQNFLQRYSHKITHLVIDVALEPLFGASTLPWSVIYGPICPKAETMTFCKHPNSSLAGRFPEWIAVVNLFAASGPTLTSINVLNRTPYEYQSWSSLVSPFITAMTFQSTSWTPQEYTNFPALTNLVIETFISRSQWRSLSEGCPRLLHLKLRLTRRHYTPTTDTRLISFPSLRSLCFHVKTFTGNSDEALVQIIFFDWMMPKLHSITLSNSCLSASSLRDILGYLGSCRQLKEADVEQVTDGGMFDVRDVLEHVHWVTSLRRLRVHNATGWFEVQDYGWEELGSWMIQARELAIEQEPLHGQCHHGTACTMNSLASLAKHCRYLDRLVIALVANSDYDFHSVPTLRSLRSLTIQHLTIDEDMQSAFAAFLAIICPNLQLFSIGCLQVVCDNQRRAASSTNLEAVFWATSGRLLGPLCALCNKDASAHVHR